MRSYSINSLFLSLCLAFGGLNSAGIVNAQPPGAGGGRGGMNMNAMMSNGLFLLQDVKVREELVLLDDQVDELEKLQEDFRNEMMKMFSGMRDMSAEDRTTAMEKVQKDMESLTKSFQDDLDEVLTKDQQKRLKQLAVQSQSRGRGVGGTLLIDDIKADLDISPELEDKIKEASEKAEKKLQEEIAKLRKNAEDEILKVLSATQRSKYREMVGDPFEFSNPFAMGNGGQRGGGQQRGGGDQRGGGRRGGGDQ